MKRYILVVVTSDGSELTTLETSLKKLVRSFRECKDSKNESHVLYIESVYFSIVNGFRAQEYSDVNWKEVLLENNDAELDVLQHVTQWNGDDLADYVHSLADQLPNFGSFLLDVVWVIVGEDAPSPENNLGLYGAFKRLQSWHEGRFTICHHQGKLFSTHPAVNTCDWVEMLNAETVSIHHLGCTVTRPGTVWSGQLCWWDHQNSEMKQFGSFRVISVENKHADGLQNAGNDIVQEKHVCFSDNLMLLSVCCLQSVPLYLFTSHRFELSARTEVAKDFLQLFDKCSNNRCAILRLSYRCGDVSNPVEENSFSKEKWRMQIALGVIQYPQWNPTADVKYVHFLFASGTLYQLRGPLELNALAYHKLATIPTIDETFMPNMDSELMFNTIPHFNGNQLHQLDKLLTADKCNTPIEVIPGLETTYFANKALELIKNKDLETSERPTKSIEDKNQKADHLEYPSDLGNLAETRSLRFRSSMTESFCRYKSSDTLGGFAPPVLTFKSPVTTVKDLLSFFTEKGEARNTPMNKLGNESVWRIGSNDRQSADAEWPLCLLSLYHDVYYNTGSDSEKLEQKSGKMREQFLNIDTLSSLDEFLPLDNSNDGNNVTRNKQLRRSPRKRKLVPPPPLQQTPKRRKVDNKDVGAVSDIVKPTKESRPHENVKSTKEISTKCSDSEDLLKRKLRVAVVEALESKGIDLNHPLFKSCGRRLFTICQSFSKDVVGKGKTSVHLKRIAESHVGPVVEFYQQLKKHSPGCKSKPN